MAACLAVCVHGCCPIEDEDGGFSHSHVCKLAREHSREIGTQVGTFAHIGTPHKCKCGKEWTEVRVD